MRVLGFVFIILLSVPFITPREAPAQTPEEKKALAEADQFNRQAVDLHRTGKYSLAEPLYQRSLMIREKLLGPAHPTVAQSLNNLAALYFHQGQYAKAEPLYERALIVREKSLGPEHQAVAISLNNLGLLYKTQGQYAKAEPLYQRSLQIRAKGLGSEHPNVAISLNNLAVLYKVQGQYVKAEPLYERSLAIREKVLGPEHPDVAESLNNLAELYRDHGQYAKAEPLYWRSLEIWTKALGSEHPNVATAVNNLAGLFRARAEYGTAESFYRRSLAISEKALGPQHPNVALSLTSLAFLYQKQGQLALARLFYEKGRQVRLASLRVNAEVDDEALRGLVTQGRSGLVAYASLLSAIARDPKLDHKPGSAQRDAFVVLEQARSGLAQSALAKASARAAAGNPESSTLARQVQDLRNQRQAFGKQLMEEYGRPIGQRNQQKLQTLQQKTQELDRELKEAVEKLNQAFPQYAELSSPDPIAVDAVQKLLNPGEALVSFFTIDDRLLTWVIRKDREPLYRDIEIKKQELKKLVSRVRTSLDQSNNPDFLQRGLLTPFDVAGSHDLYELLFAPLKEHLSGVKQLIVVPDEVLLPLPFGALITQSGGEPYNYLSALYSRGEKVNPVDQRQLAPYTQLPWLIRDYALSVLPSATSLRALRALPHSKQKETEVLMAFGDPVLEGKGFERGGMMLASRGSLVPVEEIRKLNQLPGTREELTAIAQAVGASASNSLYLGAQATKPTLTKLNDSGRLARSEVVAFSTHGLIAGELKGLKEPALVLTPPQTVTEEDNGLLGLEDILKLKLDSADWVILSACNTGAADGSGEGLAGLARAFFFAGARSLLVSHWSVEDRATQNLMTEIFKRYASEKAMPRSQAVQQGMLALLSKAHGNTAYFAHPFAWAAFFLVGDR